MRPRPCAPVARAGSIAPGRLCAVAAVLALASLPLPLFAAQRAETFVVLLRLEESVPVGWRQQAENAARTEVAAQPGLRWQKPPQVSLEETRTLLGCQSWDPACVAQIGKTLSADHVLYVEVVKPFQRRPLLTLFRVRVEAPEQTAPVSVELPDNERAGGLALQLFVRGVVRGQVPTHVLVDDEAHTAGGAFVAARADHSGTPFVLDGVRLGAVPLQLEIPLSPGRHSFGFSGAGGATLERRLQVKAGTPVALAVDVDAADPGQASKAAASVPAADYPHWESPLVWASMGAGALALIAGGLLYSNYWATAVALAEASSELDGEGRVGSMTQVEYTEAAASADPLYFSTLIFSTAGALFVAAGVALLFLPPPELAPAADAAL